MPSKAEQILSCSLRSILGDLGDGERIEDSEEFRKVLSSLEYFIPEVIGEIHREVLSGLDGVYPHAAQKIEERKADIYGLCRLMSDQTLTPFRLLLELAPHEDAISWLDCSLGTWGEQGMIRIPYPTDDSLSRLLHSLEGKADKIEWVYNVTYGDRRV